MNVPACTAGRGIHLFSHRKCVCIFVIPQFHFPQAKLQFFPPAAQILHLQIFNLQKYISSLIINYNKYNRSAAAPSGAAGFQKGKAQQ